ncbi:MAG: DUF1376 domain-containing protein [Gammaproteobacteria bacterium]|nr:DUF1376 domain-containing protein [Gammaproteobacteria bacterium]
MTHVIEVPFHIGDFLSGTMHMDATEIGAYWMLIIAHYQAGKEGLPDDDKKLATIAKVSPKVWKRIRPTIAEKFQITDSFWRHKKVVDVLRKVAENSAQKKANALKRWGTDNASASSQQCKSNANQKPITNIEDTDVSSVPPDPPSSDPPDDVGEAFDQYNAVAGRVGLPVAQVLNDTRRRGIAARLRESGGIDGWRAALEKLEASDFCAGRKTDFRADLDFLLQRRSFTKLMEGSYDNHRTDHARPASNRPVDNQLEGFSRAVSGLAEPRSGNGDVPGWDDAEGDDAAEGSGACRQDED